MNAEPGLAAIKIDRTRLFVPEPAAVHQIVFNSYVSPITYVRNNYFQSRS